MFGLVSASGDPTAPSTQSLLLAHSVANSLCNVEIVYNADEETGQLHDPVGDAQDDADDVYMHAYILSSFVCLIYLFFVGWCRRSRGRISSRSSWALSECPSMRQKLR